MSWQVPIVHSVNRRRAWPLYVLLLALFLPLPWLVSSRHVPLAVLALMGGLILWVLLSREVFTRDFRRGIRLVRRRRFDEAIPVFEKALESIERNPWIDRWRAVVLLSVSGMDYREMALCNIAFCYSQTGRRRKATELYERVHREYPENGIAIASLNMLRGGPEPDAEAV